MRFPSLASARRHLQASDAVAASANIGGRYGSFLASTAQASAFHHGLRASLLAKAHAATLRWVWVVSWASHELRPEDFRLADDPGVEEHRFPVASSRIDLRYFGHGLVLEMVSTRSRTL